MSSRGWKHQGKNSHPLQITSTSNQIIEYTSNMFTRQNKKKHSQKRFAIQSWISECCDFKLEHHLALLENLIDLTDRMNIWGIERLPWIEKFILLHKTKYIELYSEVCWSIICLVFQTVQITCQNKKEHWTRQKYNKFRFRRMTITVVVLTASNFIWGQTT